jgi:hypothetical protein
MVDNTTVRLLEERVKELEILAKAQALAISGLKNRLKTLEADVYTNGWGRHG